MRALLVSSVLLLAQLSYGQDQAAAPAAPATPAAAEETPTVTVPSAWKDGIFVSPSFSIFKRKVEQTVTAPGVNNGDVSGFNLDVKGAYTFNFGLFAGAQLAYSKGKDTSSGIDDMSTYSVGPMVGYHCSYTGLMLAATYHVLGKSKIDTAGPDVTYDKVTGLQVDLSYPIQLTDKINVGPQFTWRRLQLKEGDNSAADQKTKEFLPSISAWFYF
jgi:hypothetical protein